MGQHTWFVKEKDLFLRQREIYATLDSDDSAILETSEIRKLERECDKIEEKIDATDEFHDLFRTWKRDPYDGTYTDDFIASKEECFRWLEDNKDVVGYKHVFDDTPEREEELRLYAIDRLNEFWEKYPNGVIYFG